MHQENHVLTFLKLYCINAIALIVLACVVVQYGGFVGIHHAYSYAIPLAALLLSILEMGRFTYSCKENNDKQIKKADQHPIFNHYNQSI